MLPIILSLFLAAYAAAENTPPVNNGIETLCQLQHDRQGTDMNKCRAEFDDKNADSDMKSFGGSCGHAGCPPGAISAHDAAVKKYAEMKANDSSQTDSYISEKEKSEWAVKSTQNQRNTVQDLQSKITDSEKSTLNDVAAIHSKMPASTISQSQSKAKTKKVIQEARTAVEKDQPFPKDKADQASDISIRKKLNLISDAQEVKPELKQEESRLTDQLAELSKLAAAAAALMQGMGAADGSSGISSKSSSGISAASQVDPSLQGKNTSEGSVAGAGTSGDKGTASLSAASKLDPEDQPSPFDSPKVAEEKKARASKKSALRAALAGMLARTGAAEALSNGAFSDELKSDDTFAGAADNHETRGTGAFDVAAAAAIQGAMGKNFSMSSVDTENAVREMVNEGLSAKDISEGILLSGSTSLFVRINNAYKEIQKKLVPSASA